MCAPLLLTIGAAIGTRHVLASSDFLARRPSESWLLVADLGIFALAWAVIAASPDYTSDGVVCKDARNFDDALSVLVFASAVLGGLAWGTASLNRDSGSGKIVSYAIVAMALPYVIVVRALFATACGLD